MALPIHVSFLRRISQIPQLSICRNCLSKRSFTSLQLLKPSSPFSISHTTVRQALERRNVSILRLTSTRQSSTNTKSKKKSKKDKSGDLDHINKKSPSQMTKDKTEPKPPPPPEDVKVQQILKSTQILETDHGKTSKQSHNKNKPPRPAPYNIKGGYYANYTQLNVGRWLYVSAGLVFTIVVLGGLTRLTESGLSITEWKPVTGSIPPLSTKDWEEEFAKYRDSPEFKILNPNMSLSEYKFIYWMEWSHRQLGRFIGVSFLAGTAYFVLRKQVSFSTAWKLYLIAAGIGVQGLLGWLMVRSGLDKQSFEKPGSHPRVSQYWLAAHLGTALAVYSGMIYTGLRARGEKFVFSEGKTRNISNKIHTSSSPLRLLGFGVGGLTFMVFLTALSGAFVAGLDAGLIYNEFPKMGLGITPPYAELFNADYAPNSSPTRLIFRNLLENPATVQLEHRILATTTFSLCLAFFITAYQLRRGGKISYNVYKGARNIFLAASMQVALGISTLIYFVPTAVAVAHQANSLVLLGTCIMLGSRIWKRRLPPVWLQKMFTRQRYDAGKAAKLSK